MRLIADLRAQRPSLDVAQIAALVNPRARFEGYDELRDERGETRRFRVYTVDGYLYDRQPILVPATLSALAADTLAHDGLASTIDAARLALSAIAPDAELHARETDSQGLSGEQRALVERVLADHT